MPLLIILLFILAISRLSCGIHRYERASRRYEKILKKDPTNTKASLKCAEAYYQQALREKTGAKTIKLFDKAIEYYRRSIALDGEDLIAPTTYLHLGMAYFKKSLILKGDYFYHEAEVALKGALSRNPLLKEGHLHLGHLYYHQGRKREAHREYKKAQRLGLTDPAFNLAWYYKDNGQYDEAIRLFEKLIKTKGLDKKTLLRTRLALGWLYYNQQVFKESIEQHTKALRLDGSSVAAHYWLGKTYKAAGDREAARRQFQEVLGLDPGHKAARAQLKLVTGK